VILINLLPHREEKRKRRKTAFFVGLGVAAAAGLLIVGIWYSVLEQLASAQRARNDFLSAEIHKLEAQITDIATLKSEIESLKARQKAVEDLQTDRNIPVYLLNELVRQTPEGVYLTSLKQTDQVVLLTGVAQTNEHVSNFLRNVQNSSPWLERPELVEIKLATVPAGAREPSRRLFDFSMRLSLKRPQGSAPAPSVPASAVPRS
jgi:type IV pilus assembly protein PilN